MTLIAKSLFYWYTVLPGLAHFKRTPNQHRLLSVGQLIVRLRRLTGCGHRYALLYHRGGVYLDVKTVLIRPLRELFTDRTRAYTVLSFLGGSVYQGILATPPRNPAIWRMLVSLLRVPPATVDLQYDLVTKQAHDILTNEFKVPMQAGVQLGAQGRTQWTFFNEECALAPKSGCVGCSDVLRGKQCTNADADRYGYCCVIFMGAQPAFHTRYKDFPW